MYVHPDVPVNLNRQDVTGRLSIFRRKRYWLTGTCRTSAGCMGEPHYFEDEHHATKRWLKKGFCVPQR